MVDSIKPTYTTVPLSSSTRKEQVSNAVESHSDKKQKKQPFQKPTMKERRKKADRRKREQNSNRSVYELRSGKDRRKNDPGYPSIEIEV